MTRDARRKLLIGIFLTTWAAVLGCAWVPPLSALPGALVGIAATGMLIVWDRS